MFRRVLIIVFAAALSLLGMWWVRAGVPRVERRLHAAIQSKLSARLGRPVRIEKVKLHPLFLVLSLEQPRVALSSAPASPDLFACRRWTLFLTPIHRASRFPWIGLSFGKSRVEAPTLRLDALPAGRGGGRSAGILTLLPAHQLEWESGALHLPALGPAPAFTVEESFGDAVLSAGSASIEIAGKTPWGPVRAAGRAGVPVFESSAPRWKTAILLPEARLEDLTALLPSPPPGRWSGPVQASLTLQGGFTRTPVENWSVELLLKGASVAVGARPWPLSGELKISPEKIDAHLAVSQGALKIDGGMERPFKQEASRWDLSIQAVQFPLEELRDRLPFVFLSAIPWRGRVSGESFVKGARSNPDITASFQAEEAGAGALVAPTLKASVTSEPASYTVKAAFAGGDVSGRIPRSRAGDIPRESTFHLEGISLETLAAAGGWGPIGGLLGGDFALMMDGPPLAGGVFRLQNAAWGDHRLEEPLVSYFSWKEGAVRFHDKKDLLDLTADRSGDTTSARLVYARADGTSVRAEGTIRHSDGSIHGNATMERLSLRDIPFLLRRYPDIEGSLHAEVSLDGTTSAPVVAADFSAGKIRLLPGAGLHGFHGTGRWESSALSLEDLSLDGTWTGSALRLPGGEWRLLASVKDADPSLLSELALSSAPVAGKLSAAFAAEGGGKNPWSGSLSAALSQTRMGPISGADVQTAWGGGRATLDHLSVETASGTLRFSGEAQRRGRGGWGFVLRGPFIEEARGKALVTPRGIELTEVVLGDGMKAGAVADFSHQTLAARLSLTATPAVALARRSGMKFLGVPQGRLRGELRAKGSFKAPAVEANLSWEEASWRGVPLEAQLSGGWSGGILRIGEGRVSTPPSGALRFSGEVPTDEGGAWDLSWHAQDLPLRLIPAPLSGRGGGSGTVTGPRRDPRAAFSLQAPDARLEGMPPLAVDLQGAVEGKTLTFSRAEASSAEGTWRARSGAVLRRSEEGFTFESVNDLRNIQFGPLSFFGGLKLAGSWSGLDVPRLNMTLSAEDLWINQQVFDKDLAWITWSGGKIVFDPPPGAAQRLTGTVDVSRWPQARFDGVSLWDGADRRVHLNGEAGPDLWRFTLEGHALEAGTLLSLADFGVDAEGPVDALVNGRGSAEDPKIEVDISGRDGRVEGVPYDRLALTLFWDGGRTELRALEAVRRRGYALTGHGEWVPSPDPDAPPRATLFLRVTDGDLAVLKDFWPGCREAGGHFNGEISLSPTEGGGSATKGFFVLEKGFFRGEQYVKKLSDLSARLRFANAGVEVEELSGRAGKGRFSGKGRVDMDGLRVRGYDLALRSEGKRGIPIEVPQLSVPPGPLLQRFSFLRRTLAAPSQGSPTFDLTLKGPHGDHVIAGEIVLEDTHFTFPPPKDAFKSVSRGSWLGEFWHDAAWDLVLKTGKDTWYRNEFVNVRVNGGVAIAGPRDDLRVSGKIGANQGIVNYLSQPFQLKKALLEMETDARAAGPEGNTVSYLSGEAERTATTLDNRGVAALDVITMVIPRARLSEINPRFVSRNNPGLPSDRVFQRMLGFSAQDRLQPPSAEEQGQLARAGLVQVLGASVGPAANRLARIFGIDMISTIYEPTAPTGNPVRTPETQPVGASEGAGGNRAASRWSELLRGAGASAGVQLSERLFGLYKFKVDQTVQNRVYLHDEVQVVGRLRGNLFLKFSSELDARSVLGQPPNRQALLEQQWRFGLPGRRKKKEEPQGDGAQAP